MIIPETETPFHKWHESKYGEDIGMTYSEIYSELKDGKNKELLLIAEEYSEHFSRLKRKLWESRISYEIL